MPTDNVPLTLVDRIADDLVKRAAVKARIEAVIDADIDSGEIVATAKVDAMNFFGKFVVPDADDKLVFTESYTAPGDIVRPAGQSFEFAWKEFKEARPHISGKLPEPTDLEADAFGEGSKSPLKARGDLIKEFGIAAANLRAQAWGLESIADFGVGTRPDPNGTDANKPKLDKIKADRKNNPWSYDGASHEEYAEFIRTKGTAAAREAAAKAGKQISGKPLPAQGTFRRV